MGGPGSTLNGSVRLEEEVHLQRVRDNLSDE
jgi:hypothetical protein